MNKLALHKVLIVAVTIALGSLSIATDASARGGGHGGGGAHFGGGGGHFGGGGMRFGGGRGLHLGGTHFGGAGIAGTGLRGRHFGAYPARHAHLRRGSLGFYDLYGYDDDCWDPYRLSPVSPWFCG